MKSFQGTTDRREEDGRKEGREVFFPLKTLVGIITSREGAMKSAHVIADFHVIPKVQN